MALFPCPRKVKVTGGDEKYMQDFVDFIDQLPRTYLFYMMSWNTQFTMFDKLTCAWSRALAVGWA